MNTQTFIKNLRLLPSVIALGFVLLIVKGAGFAMEARAQSTNSESAKPDAATEAKPTAQAPDARADAAVDPAADPDESASAAEVDVLTSLGKRRDELDTRAKDLDMRENLITAAEKRVDGKIAELKTLQGSILSLLKQRDEAEAKQLASLVKTYSSMKAKDAARIFDTLDKDVLIAVAGAMKPDALASILAAMQPKAAQSLTLDLADKLQLPEKPKQEAMAAPAQVQTAQVQPAAQAQTQAPTPAAPSPAQAISAPGAAAETPAAQPDAKIPDAKAPDAKTADTKVPDAKTPDTKPKPQDNAAK